MSVLGSLLESLVLCVRFIPVLLMHCLACESCIIVAVTSVLPPTPQHPTSNVFQDRFRLFSHLYLESRRINLWLRIFVSDLRMSDSNGLCIPSVCTDGSLVSHPSLTSDLRTRNLFSSQDITEWPIESNAQTFGVLKIFCNVCIMSVVTNVTPWVRITLVGRLHGGNRL